MTYPTSEWTTREVTVDGVVAEVEAQIEKMKRYLDCEYCEHYTQSYGCKNCNEELRSDWSLRR